MSYRETTRKIELLQNKIAEMEATCRREQRQPFDFEQSIMDEMRDAVAAFKKELPQDRVTVPNNGALGGNYATSSIRHDGAYALVSPNGLKDYKALFGNSGYNWPDKDTNFFAAAFSGRHHPGLIRNSMSETVPSDGGFLVPSEQAERIHAVSLENELVMPRAYVQPMRSNTIKIPAMSIGDHSSALFGGFTASYTAELGTISENSPKARAMELNAKKLTGLIRFSSELNADTPGGMGQIETLCGKGLAWYRDKAFLKGTGAGQPLGILNADCTIEVSAESGQAADTIVYENLTNMMARLFAGSFVNSVWVCHQTCIPQLLSLSLAVAYSGEVGHLFQWIPATCSG